MTKESILQKLRVGLELRGRSESTIRWYLGAITAYQDYYDKPADQMGECEIAEYLHFLITKKKLKASTVNGRNSTLRFLYNEILDTSLDLRKIPTIKTKRAYPDILSKEEVQAIFDNTKTLQYRAMFMLAYGSGLRLSEVINLKVCDIDSKQMRVFVRQGKGRKDRFTILPQSTLDILRKYWLEHRPDDWLFVRKKSNTPHHKRTVYDSLKRAVKRAGIKKRVSPHTLRHCFTTHLLNDGYDVCAISKLLGHARLDATAWYIHLTDKDTRSIKSPLDTMQVNPDV